MCTSKALFITNVVASYENGICNPDLLTNDQKFLMSKFLSTDKSMLVLNRHSFCFVNRLKPSLRVLDMGDNLYHKYVKLMLNKLFQFKTHFSKAITLFFIGLLFLPLNALFVNCSAVGYYEYEGVLESPSLTEDELALGQKLYTTNCAACHGQVLNSTKKGRSVFSIQEAMAKIPQMAALKNLPLSSIQEIARALEYPKIPTTTIGGRLAYACDPNQIAKTPMTKLTNREFKTAMFLMMDDFASGRANLKSDTALVTMMNNMPTDELNSGRATFSEYNFFLTAQISKAYFEVAYRVGEILVGTGNDGLPRYPNTSGCLGASPITLACYQNFVREFASRAFRKNVSVTEANTLATSMWDANLSKADLIQTTFTSVVMMPEFLYRTYDQGSVSAKGSRVLTLNAYDLASKVSYFLVGKAPDTTLKTLAASGQIFDNAILSQQIDRLLLTTDAQDMVMRLFRESYGYNRFDSTFSYSSNFLNGLNTSGLQSSMTEEVDNFFIDTVLNKKGSFRDLMTSQSANVPSDQLAAVYGSVRGVTMLESNRAGFINRAAFLARRSGNYTSPVKRGLSVLENVLCETIGDPPPNAPTSVSESQIVNQLQSTRERYAHLSEMAGTSCVACHSRINSLGYTFEGFDSIGRARSVERIFETATGPSTANVNIDTQTVVKDLRPTPTPINSSTELAADLANNDKAMLCFVKHMKVFQSRTPATAADGCQMNNSLKSMYGVNGNQGSVQSAIKEMILSEDFKLWSY